MDDYFLYTDQPIIIELEQRLTPIIRGLIRSEFSYRSLYKAQEKLLEELLAIEESIQLARKERSEIRKTTDELAIKLRSKKGQLSESDKNKIKLRHEEVEQLDFAIKLLRMGIGLSDM